MKYCILVECPKGKIKGIFEEPGKDGFEYDSFIEADSSASILMQLTKDPDFACSVFLLDENGNPVKPVRKYRILHKK